MAADDQRKFVMITVLNLLLTTVSLALQFHSILAIQLLLQQEEIKRKLRVAIEERNRALGRYRVLRNRFLRRKRRHWKNPGRTGAWWLNAWNGVLTEEEWHVNFRMSRADFSDLLKTLKPYISPNPNSFRPDAISAEKKISHDTILSERSRIPKNDK